MDFELYSKMKNVLQDVLSLTLSDGNVAFDEIYEIMEIHGITQRDIKKIFDLI